MSRLPVTKIPKDPNRSTQNAVSPFRYPGGKGFMSAFLKQRMQLLEAPTNRVLAEPFCGGAGAALILLADGFADQIMLNDADLRIFSAWHAILEEPERFVAKLRKVSLDMQEWYRHRDLVAGFSDNKYDFDVGFSTFYMNRTTRSGIIMNAGPIGGYDQRGKWKLDARFNVERLANQVEWLAANRNRLELSNMDALSFIDRVRRKPTSDNTMFFIDPPYVKAGGRLYFDGMSEAKHVALSDILTSGTVKRWVLTYDDAPLIRQLYRSQTCSNISVNYSLQSKRRENEILVEPNYL
ncbi:DNA adenine methylase [Pseudaestuariivita sp.]|uniref:DNA adenine methylase n=1 Tax=Pseudaestuariivita sp. TaxID=2211669 RepID=UPI004059C5CA